MIKQQSKEYEFCLRCGKKLKSLENRLRGYGLICWKKSKISKKAKLF